MNPYTNRPNRCLLTSPLSFADLDKYAPIKQYQRSAQSAAQPAWPNKNITKLSDPVDQNEGILVNLDDEDVLTSKVAIEKRINELTKRTELLKLQQEQLEKREQCTNYETVKQQYETAIINTPRDKANTCFAYLQQIFEENDNFELSCEEVLAVHYHMLQTLLDNAHSVHATTLNFSGSDTARYEHYYYYYYFSFNSTLKRGKGGGLTIIINIIFMPLCHVNTCSRHITKVKQC
jgi:hypothetical protein